MDDVCKNNLNFKILNKVFKKKNIDLWDSISFISNPYYDLWALSTPNFFLSCFNFENSGENIVNLMRNKLENKLKKNKYVKVLSAFNGFAIYKIPIFLKSLYASQIKDNLNFFTHEEIKKNEYKCKSKFKINNLEEEDCEHRFFHCYAFYNFDAKIIICNKSIFS